MEYLADKTNILNFLAYILYIHISAISPSTAQQVKMYDAKVNAFSVDSTVKACSALDFMKLKEARLQEYLFIMLDSTLREQKPEEIDTSNFVDITPALLSRFLKDVDVKVLEKTGRYSHKYDFKRSLPQYTDTKECADEISIEFMKDSSMFIMSIDNSYQVDDLGCAGGGEVLYYFRICQGRIYAFVRQMAG